MGWIYLLIASVFEVVFALGTKGTAGFTEFWPSVVTVLAAGAGIFTLSLALRTVDVGIGYTVWTGIGATGTVLLGAVLYDEQLTLAKLAFFALIVGGVISLHLISRAEERTKAHAAEEHDEDKSAPSEPTQTAG